MLAGRCPATQGRRARACARAASPRRRRRPSRAASVSRPSTAARATGRRTRGSRRSQKPGSSASLEPEARGSTCALPEVEVRARAAAPDRRARGPAARRRTRTPPRRGRREVLERQVRRVAAVAEREHEGGVVLDRRRGACRRRRPARPCRASTTSSRSGCRPYVLGREGHELLPRPRAPVLAAGDRERPVLERRARRRAGREHREVVRQVLAGRQAPASSASLRRPRNPREIGMRR